MEYEGYGTAQKVRIRRGCINLNTHSRPPDLSGAAVA
jgi:hypothetical protein